MYIGYKLIFIIGMYIKDKIHKGYWYQRFGEFTDSLRKVYPGEW